jgi:hypothetical protein
MWSFVRIGQEWKELSCSQHRPIRCRRTSLICAEIAGCQTWPRQCHNKAICEGSSKSVKNWRSYRVHNIDQSHRPIRCRRNSLICAKIAGCRTWPRQIHKKAICEVSSESIKNWRSYRVHNVTVTDARTDGRTEGRSPKLYPRVRAYGDDGGWLK